MVYRFDTFILDTDEFSLQNGSSHVSVEPKVLEVLVYLVKNNNRIVSRDELIEQLWKGRGDSDAALSSCIRSIKRALKDKNGRKRYIQAFPQKGVQFIRPLFEDENAKIDSTLPQKTPKREKRKRHNPALISIIIISVAVFSVVLKPFLVTEEADPYFANKTGIAVLNFSTSAPTEQQRYLTEGLLEELTSDLSLYAQLFVIDRSSSMRYHGTPIDTQEIGEQLGVSYIVNGNVKYEKENIQISVQLDNASSGKAVWQHIFNQQLSDHYTFNNELAYHIAKQIFPDSVLPDAEANNRKIPQDMDAWALYHKARLTQTVYTQDMQQQAIDWSKKALQLDSSLAAAYGLIAKAKGVQYAHQWTKNTEQTLKDAIQNAATSIDIDINEAGAYTALGYIYRNTGNETLAIANLKKAVSLRPNDADIKLEYAHALDWFKHPKKALPEIIQAIRLSPRDSRLQDMYFCKALIQFHLFDYKSALETTRKMSGVLTTNNLRVDYHLIRAANLAQLDKLEQAKMEINNALLVNPKLNLATLRETDQQSQNHQENRRFWLESLAKAGLPQN